jgi:hypothetical protein
VTLVGSKESPTFSREWTRRNANRNPIIRGNSSGAFFAAGLLCWPLPALLHAGILGVTLTVMQLIGPKRYAVWTFCLTVIAFDLKSVLPQEIG